MKTIKKFLELENKNIQKISKKYISVYWDALITGKDSHYTELEKQIKIFKTYFNNKERFNEVKKFVKIAEENIEKRQLDILLRIYTGNQGNKKILEKIAKKESEIEKKFNTFRVEFKGKKITDNEVKEILQNEKNSSTLKEVWEKSKEQGALVEKELLELVKLRNELAKSLGFENYQIMSLELSEQKPEEIEKLFEEMEFYLDGAFDELKNNIDEVLSKKYNISKKELKPWHYQDLFFQKVPKSYSHNLNEISKKDVIEIAKKFYLDIGFDVSEILKKSDLYEKPGKYQHACCIDMDSEGDIRIIQNTKNNENWMETTLHELGHAVYSQGHTRKDFPFLLRDSAHIFVTEAIALLFERTSKNSFFLKKYLDISEEKIETIKNELKQDLRADELIFSRWAQVMYYFEKNLYSNPNQNLNELWWKLVKKYQKIDFERNFPDWASKIHIASSPIYYHNYLLGKFLASQLNQYILKKILKSKDKINIDYSDKKIGKYLLENIFKKGKLEKWDILIKNSTGEKLTPKYFAEEFKKI